jgi:hypothetical protein
MTRKCTEFVVRFHTFNDPEDLGEHLEAVLKSDASCTPLMFCANCTAEEVQETLLGILGFDDMDFIQDLLTHRNELVQFT